LAGHAVEPGKRMTWPLLVLAFFALTLGFINVPFLGSWLHGFAGEVHLIAEEAAPGIAFEAIPFSITVAVISTVLALVSGLFGWWLYSQQASATALDPIQRIPVIGRPIFTILYNKYYFDELYRGLIIYPVMSLSDLAARFDYDWVINPIVNFVGRLTNLVADGTAVFDRVGIDGYFVNGIPGALRAFGGQLRLLQTGRAQTYLLILVVGLLILVAVYLAIWGGQAGSLANLPSS
jgi:NADH:ubiquinone oxidoreductase subunit 5 (subunit L)/multisubunit Na+/H+ antiporter MnhA subunit